MLDKSADSGRGAAGFGATARKVRCPSVFCESVLDSVEIGVGDCDLLVGANVNVFVNNIVYVFCHAGAIPSFKEDRAWVVVDIDW